MVGAISTGWLMTLTWWDTSLLLGKHGHVSSAVMHTMVTVSNQLNCFILQHSSTILKCLKINWSICLKLC